MALRWASGPFEAWAVTYVVEWRCTRAKRKSERLGEGSVSPAQIDPRRNEKHGHQIRGNAMQNISVR